uniref:Uncharacterized protein n=1 Tax=Lactuca sativa TaxID=4236 RepID=A0A9R1W415_LACSA|nr:hypothetical protein LSAT_V11C300102540 [Lactuca sativa]
MEKDMLNDLNFLYVVPYNMILLKQYQAHMNLEWCNQFGSIKHAEDFFGMTFIIEHHLLKGCRFTYKTNNLLCLNHPNVLQMLFLNQLLLLLNFWPRWNVIATMKRQGSYPMLNSQLNMFGINQIKYGQEEKQRQLFSRINHVSLKCGDVYYLRILLNKVKGPTCYEDIRMVNGTVYDSYKDACYALGLLDDDREYILYIQETHHSATASFCRSLFVMLITSDTLSRPHHVFKETYSCLSDDVVHVHEQEISVKGLKLKP